MESSPNMPPSPQPPLSQPQLNPQESPSVSPEKKSKKWSIIILVLLLFTVSGVTAYFLYQNYQLKRVPFQTQFPSGSSQTLPSTPQIKPSPFPSPSPTSIIPQADYSKSGNIVADCQLLYEEIGAPALTATLIFQDYSQCDLGQGIQPCQEVETSLTCGQPVKIEGKVKSSPKEILVIKLTLLPNPEYSEIGGNCCFPSQGF